MYYLGVDGGGTKTDCVVISSDGKLRYHVRLGPGNITVLDRGTVANLVLDITHHLPEGVTADTVAAAVFAFAGAGRAREKRIMEALISGAGFRSFRVITDAEILYQAIFDEARGILIAAGTGAICLYRGADGKLHQIGGIGYLLGDEGSAFDIGRQAIQQAVRDAQSGRAPGALTGHICNFFGIKEPQDLISIIYSSVNPPNLIASCAKVVARQAAQGDADARKLVDNAAGELRKLLDRAAADFAEGETLHVALAGSVLRGTAPVAVALKKMIGSGGRTVDYRSPALIPAAAAAVLAMKLDGVTAPRELLDGFLEIK